MLAFNLGCIHIVYIFVYVSAGVAWPLPLMWQDEERKFQQPDGFVFVECDSGDCLACLDSEFSSTGDDYRNCELYSDRSGVDYAYWYPFNDDIQVGSFYL